MGKRGFLLLLASVATLMAIFVFAFSGNNSLNRKSSNITSIPSPTPSIKANSKKEDLGDGLVKYTSYDFGFEITVPDYFNIEEHLGQNVQQVVISYKVAAKNSAKDTSGLSDGIGVSITYAPSSPDSGIYSLPFQEIVNKNGQATKVNLRYIQAYYKKDPLTTFPVDDYFIKRNDENYYALSVYVVDPNHKGYQQIANTILNSFKLINE